MYVGEGEEIRGEDYHYWDIACLRRRRGDGGDGG